MTSHSNEQLLAGTESEDLVLRPHDEETFADVVSLNKVPAHVDLATTQRWYAGIRDGDVAGRRYRPP